MKTIYAIVENDGKVIYVGLTVNLSRRKGEHEYQAFGRVASAGSEENRKPIYKRMRELGRGNYTFKKIAESDKSYAKGIEMYFSVMFSDTILNRNVGDSPIREVRDVLASISEKRKKRVDQYSIDGVKVATYKTAKDAAESTGYSVNSICIASRGKTNPYGKNGGTHFYKGFIWKYNTSNKAGRK